MINSVDPDQTVICGPRSDCSYTLYSLSSILIRPMYRHLCNEIKLLDCCLGIYEYAHNKNHLVFIMSQQLLVNTCSCIDIYSYSCLHPLSNERKSMFKSGDSRAVWTWVWTWKYLKWALHYLHDVIYGTHCGPDWSFRRCFCSRKRCVRLWRNDVRKYTADAILFREIQCKKMDNLMF